MRISIWKSSDNIIPVDRATGGEIDDPILWCRDGEYCIVPVAVIKNAVNTLSMYAVSKGKRTQPTPVILWSQGIPINNAAGRALIGE